MQKFAIIVAGGKGLRMGTEIPKQFLILQNKPILAYSIEAFYKEDSATKIIIVLPQEQEEYWKYLCKEYSITIPHTIVYGGKERFFSVKNGLSLVNPESVVAIHDGVRPLIDTETIRNGFNLAKEKNSAIPVIDSIDSLRITENGTSKSINRNTVKRVQTPQVFSSKKLLKAYNTDFLDFFTDDASVFENTFDSIFTFSGNDKNIKITNEFDLKIANAFLE